VRGYHRRRFRGEALGFIEVEGLVFGQKMRVVVDPTEERLQREFEGVKRCFPVPYSKPGGGSSES
jgi:hypothetical protein